MSGSSATKGWAVTSSSATSAVPRESQREDMRVARVSSRCSLVDLLQQYGPYGAVFAVLSLLILWLKLRHVRYMAGKHGPDHALRYASILFKTKQVPRPRLPQRRRLQAEGARDERSEQSPALPTSGEPP